MNFKIKLCYLRCALLDLCRRYPASKRILGPAPHATRPAFARLMYMKICSWPCGSIICLHNLKPVCIWDTNWLVSVSETLVNLAKMMQCHKPEFKPIFGIPWTKLQVQLVKYVNHYPPREKKIGKAVEIDKTLTTLEISKMRVCSTPRPFRISNQTGVMFKLQEEKNNDITDTVSTKNPSRASRFFFFRFIPGFFIWDAGMIDDMGMTGGSCENKDISSKFSLCMSPDTNIDI